MSMRELEAAVLAELKQVAQNKKIKMKDVMEWSTGEVKAQEGETLFYLPELHVNCAVKLPIAKAPSNTGVKADAPSAI